MIDFLVIGGGIAGLSAGARLTAFGSVAVLEAESALGYHATGRSAAMFEENYGKPAVVALNRASRSFLQDGGYLSPRGVLLVGRTSEAATFATDCETLDLHPISTKEAQAMIPVLDMNVVDRAAYHDTAQDIDTDRLVQGFARHIRAAGGKVTTNARVNHITRTDTGWQVEVAENTYTARTLVNAAGPWADDIARMADITPLGLQPMRRSMGRIPPPADCDVSSWPMLFGPGENWYAKPDAGALIVSPAEETPVDPHDAYADDMILAEGVARFEEYVTTQVTRMQSTWGGLRTFAPDRQLVIGPDPLDPKFLWNAGQGGYGFSTAPAASQLLADLVGGVAPEIDAEAVAQLRPDRFR